MGYAFKIIIDYLIKHGLSVEAPGPFSSRRSGYDLKLKNQVVGRIYPSATSIILSPHPNKITNVYDLSYADPDLFPKLDPYIHKVKNSCPHCGDEGPPKICDHCMEQIGDYYADLRQSRGY